MNIIKLVAGHILTVTAGERTTSAHQVEGADGATFALGSRTFGPYLVDRTFLVSEWATTAIATADIATQFSGALTLSAGAPVDAAQATIGINPAGDDNGLTFTAKAYGVDGNNITIAYLDPGANDAVIGVAVSGNTIEVSLATGVAGAITSTAAEVLAAIEASVAAAALVSVAIDAADSGGADDGSGIVTAIAATNLEGGAGTGIGVALKGGICIDTTNGAIYTNTGTKAVPDWTASITTAAYGTLSGIVNGLAALHLYGAGAPVDYTDGSPPATGEGIAPKAAIYSDTTNGFVYRNSGTQAQPIWTKLADAV